MGFGGDHLFDRHTRTHARELWQPALSETGTYDAWLQAGGTSTIDRARERVGDILAAPVPEPLPEDLGREFERVIAAAEEAAVS